MISDDYLYPSNWTNIYAANKTIYSIQSIQDIPIIIDNMKFKIKMGMCKLMDHIDMALEVGDVQAFKKLAHEYTILKEML